MRCGCAQRRETAKAHNSDDFGSRLCKPGCSYTEALAATATLARIRVVEAHATNETFLYDVKRRALQVWQARSVDNDAHALAFEHLVIVADRRGRIDAIAEARAAVSLHREAHRHRAGMLRELHGEMFRRAPDWAKPALARIGFARAQEAR